MTVRPQSSQAPVIAFDLDSDGHHPSYLQYLAEHWLAQAPSRELILVVGRDFPDRHPDVVALSRTGLVRFDPIERPAPPRLPGRLGGLAPLANGLLQWRALADAARRHRADHAVVMYIDQMLQSALALHLPAPCAVSGIYFRPAFHYAALAGARSPGLGDQKRALRQRMTLRSALRHRRLHTLWTLDPYAVPHIEALGPARVRALADPVPATLPDPTVVAQLATRYEIPPAGTTTLLLFGALSARKGVLQALRAVSQVAAGGDSPHLTLLLVGRAPEAFRGALSEAVSAAEAAGVRVVRDHSFVPEAHVQAYFELADIVLAPYQRHVGSSGIAIRAARAGRPLLASNYGMLGESVRREGLGVAVDATDVGALADGLRDLLDHRSRTSAEGMARFADQNTATAFTTTIRHTLCGDMP